MLIVRILCFQEKILLDSMFEVPGSDIVDVIIDEDTVRGKAPAQYVRRPSDVSPDVEDEPVFEEVSARNP